MKAIRHFMTITKHRFLVAKYCFRVGLVWQGLTHDLSKYSPAEFIVGAKYYQGFRSPNTAERADRGYSAAWLHHKGRNKHHYEYWTDYTNTDVVSGYFPVEMPKRYLCEMFFDRIAASRTYSGDKYTDASPLEYFERVQDWRRMHEKTHEALLKLLTMLAEQGEDAVFEYIKKEILGK